MSAPITASTRTWKTASWPTAASTETYTLSPPGALPFVSRAADGCFIEGTVTDCILFPGVRVARGAQLSRCIVMQDTHIAADAILRNVIADKNVRIGPAVTLTGCEALPIVIPKGSEL